MKLKILPIIILAGLVAASCTQIDIQEDFDFAVETLPYRKDIEGDSPVRLDFRITAGEDGHLHDSTRYYLSYFLYEGHGSLSMEDSILTPNQTYLIGRTVSLLYTPLWGESGSHQLELTFSDNWDHRQTTTIELTNQETGQ